MSLKWSFEILRGAVRDLRQNLWPLARLDLYVKLLVITVLTPAAGWLANSLVTRAGRLKFANDQIFGFLASPPGIVWLVMAGTMAAAIGFLQAGGIQIIAQQRWQGVQQKPGSALVGILRRATDLVRLGARVVTWHLAVTFPFVIAFAAAYRWMLQDYEINYLVHETPPVWWIALGIACVLIAGASAANLLVYLLWVVALPAMLFEKIPPAAALRRSRSLVRGHLRRVTILVALAVGNSVLLPVFAVGVIHILGRAVFLVFSGSPRTAVVLVVLLLLLEGVALVTATFIGAMIAALTQSRLWLELARPGDELASALEHPSEAVSKVPVVVVWGALALGLIAAAATTWRAISRFDLQDRVQITAHRGSSESAPENTLPAIRQAIEDGAHWAEIDVRETADGEVIVVHDEDFMRFAGDRRKVWDMTLDEIREFDVGGWFDPVFAGERVPTLQEAIAVARGRMGLNIELKFRRSERSLAERTVEILQNEGFVDQAIVTSLDLTGLAHVEDIDPAIRTGAIIYGKIGQLSEMKWEVLAIATRLATRDAVVTAQRAGKEVLVWTVNDPNQLNHFIDLGVNNILTDRPLELASLLAERAELTDEERLLLRLRTWLGW